MTDSTGSVYAAEAYIDAGNFDAAIDMARALLAEKPDNLDAMEVLARAHLCKNDIKQAKAVAQDLIAAAPGDDAGHRTLAICLLSSGKKKPAHEAAQKAVECAPDNAANHVVLALVLEDMTKFEDAERSFRKALELSPDFTYAKTAYADFLLSRGRADEAARLVEEVSAREPGDIDVILMRGKMALRAGNVDEARDNAMWALQEDATNYEALHLLAQVKMRTRPLMGLWWRYAVWMEKFTNVQRWLIVIALYIAWRFFYAGIAAVIGPAAIVLAVAWLVFCVLTWIGPTILNHMVKRELKSVQIRPF